jgi:hypothetical protein
MAPKEATKTVTGKKIKLNAMPKGEKVSSMKAISTGTHYSNGKISIRNR